VAKKNLSDEKLANYKVSTYAFFSTLSGTLIKHFSVVSLIPWVSTGGPRYLRVCYSRQVFPVHGLAVIMYKNLSADFSLCYPRIRYFLRAKKDHKRQKTEPL